MSIPENAPQWLKDARTENANVEITSRGYVIWHGGDWRGGVWHGGDWRGGVWHGGDWLSGDWRGGVWLSGDWRGGVWHGGDWRGGDWRGGVWLSGDWHGGDWLSGDWRGGDWRGGDWRGGVWHGGDWHGGFTAIKSKWRITYNGDKIRIGCKEKTFKEWDKWFKSKEEFETKRTAKLFEMIHAHYQAIKTYAKHLNKPEKKEKSK